MAATGQSALRLTMQMCMQKIAHDPLCSDGMPVGLRMQPPTSPCNTKVAQMLHTTSTACIMKAVLRHT